ncbi:hypothetical protein [Williamsia sp.]|uniref:hypothetical protein n=1 Tax=Williamsia sp. TaxID=1872085 RepID=UPI002F923D8B
MSQTINADNLTVTRAELEYLKDKLDQVVDLERRMAIALTDGQSRNSDGGLGIRRPQPGPREPYGLHVEVLLDELQNELTTTVRHICEVRGLSYQGSRYPTALAKWLIRYRVAIAVMEDGGEIFKKLCRIIDRCARSMNTNEREYTIDEEMVKEANRQIVTVSTIEKLAHKLDKVGKGLNARRMRTLCKHAGLTHVSEDPDTGTRFYRLGDVLDAHKRHASRNRA